MSNHIERCKENTAISVIERYDIGELIKPIVKEILLLDTYVAGISMFDDKDRFLTVSEGDELLLKRAADTFDPYSILIEDSNNVMFGYVPEKDNLILARLMDAGKILKSKVTERYTFKDYLRIKIQIFLVDL